MSAPPQTDVIPVGYDDVIALVTQAGVDLARSATQLDPTLVEDLLDESRTLFEQLGLAPDQVAAGSATWREGFMAGAVHAVREVSDAFRTSLGDEAAADRRRKAETNCHLVGRWMATIQIGRLLRLLAVGVSDTNPSNPGEQGYVQGMEYALDRMIGAFQTRLEQAVLGIRQLPDPSDEQRRVATLLFVALAEPNRNRVIEALGPRAEPILVEADERKWVTCLDDTNRPMRVTGRGAVVTLELASQVAA